MLKLGQQAPEAESDALRGDRRLDLTTNRAGVRAPSARERNENVIIHHEVNVWEDPKRA